MDLYEWVPNWLFVSISIAIYVALIWMVYSNYKNRNDDYCSWR